MKKDFKSESTVLAIVGTIVLAIGGAFLAFDHKVIFLFFTIISVCVYVGAVLCHYYKPKPPTPSVEVWTCSNEE